MSPHSHEMELEQNYFHTFPLQQCVQNLGGLIHHFWQLISAGEGIVFFYQYVNKALFGG